MTAPAAVRIAGHAMQVGRLAGRGIEAAVREVVGAALARAGITLDEVDTLVTVGSDILDGAMVATHSGIAGSYGHSLLTVPSSAGHALAAALSMIQGGGARNVLLAGWGEGSKFAELDGRIIQADPFYARPLGAGAAEMAALQAQRLVATGRLRQETAARYAERMAGRAGITAGRVGWLATGWCDGACALMLTTDGPGATIGEIGTAFEPYAPEPDALDPAGWVAAASAGFDLHGLAAIEVGGPTPMSEMAAAAGLRAVLGWDALDERINPSGGGAVAHFGPATGLCRMVAAAEAARDGGRAAAIDLAGPIGQATTVVVLEGGRA